PLDVHAVSPGVAVGLAAADGLRRVASAAAVGAGQDERVRAAPGRQRRLDLAAHLLYRDHLLLAHLAATDRRLLVLKEQAGRTQCLIAAHRARHVLDVAEAVAGVHQHRQRRRCDDLPDGLVQFYEENEARAWPPAPAAATLRRSAGWPQARRQ